MTSINAIRFDAASGAMVCDEQRHWNEERFKVFAADKILPVVPEAITAHLGLAAAYGNTGTSSIGDELRLTIRRRVEERYAAAAAEAGRPPEKFLDVSEIAAMAFEIMVGVKHRHVDDGLLEHYGFTTEEFVQGFYERAGRRLEIGLPQVVEKAHRQIAVEPGSTAPGPVFGNAGIVAGVDRHSGFRIFLFSMREQTWEQVETGFTCQGSGSDTTNFLLGRHFSRPAGSDRTDRLDALIVLVGAVDAAMVQNLGVGGYPAITVFDSRGSEPEAIMRQVNDHRSHLLAEAIRAEQAGLVARELVRELTDGLVFGGRPYDWAEERLWAGAGDARGLHRFLRGY